MVTKLIRPEKKDAPKIDVAPRMAVAKKSTKDEPRTGRKTTRKAQAAKARPGKSVAKASKKPVQSLGRTMVVFAAIEQVGAKAEAERSAPEISVETKAVTSECDLEMALSWGAADSALPS